MLVYFMYSKVSGGIVLDLILKTDLHSSIESWARLRTLTGGSKYLIKSGCGEGKGFSERSDVMAP